MAGLELHETAAIGDYDTLEHYIRSGKYDVNLPDMEWGKRTALHWAAWKGFVECMRLLIDHGARPSCKMAGGWTPAHCAAEAGRANVLRALHTMNISIMKRDNFGDTPKSIAKVYGHLECVRQLEQFEQEEQERRLKLGKPEVSDDEIEPSDDIV